MNYSDLHYHFNHITFSLNGLFILFYKILSFWNNVLTFFYLTVRPNLMEQDLYQEEGKVDRTWMMILSNWNLRGCGEKTKTIRMMKAKLNILPGWGETRISAPLIFKIIDFCLSCIVGYDCEYSDVYIDRFVWVCRIGENF